MAKIGDITCDKNDGSKASYDSETSTFLTEAEVNEFKNMLKKGGLNNIQSNFIDVINNAVGLKPEMLNIAGRAPLSELSEELVARVKVTIEDVETIPLIAEAEANKHRQLEANTYWTLVQKAQQELKNDALAAADAYNDEVNEKNHQITKYNSEHKNDPDFVPKKHYHILDKNENETFRVIENKDVITGVFDQAANVREKYGLLTNFKVKYDLAKKLDADMSILSTSLDGYKICTSEGEKLPEGVQVGAKKQVIDRNNHGETIRYTNPDGSTVEIKTSKDGNSNEDGRTVTSKNRQGYLTSKIKYNADGQETSKKEYKYVSTDVKGAYKTTITTTKGDETTSEEKYTYYDMKGNYQIADDKPKQSEVKRHYDDPKDYYKLLAQERLEEAPKTETPHSNDRLVGDNRFTPVEIGTKSSSSLPSGYSFLEGYEPDEEAINNVKQIEEDRKANSQIIQPASDAQEEALENLQSDNEPLVNGGQ